MWGSLLVRVRINLATVIAIIITRDENIEDHVVVKTASLNRRRGSVNLYSMLDQEHRTAARNKSEQHIKLFIIKIGAIYM